MAPARASLAVLAVSIATLAFASAALAGTQSYTTPGTYTFQVPAGVTQLAVEACGAEGGGSILAGGLGGCVSATIPVMPLESLVVVVGGTGGGDDNGPGPGGFNGGGDGDSPGGGGGGGASDVRQGGNTLGDRVIVGGGGGGGGGAGSVGGAGGGTTAAAGGNNSGATGGGGGTQSAGGAGGAGSLGGDGDSGSLGLGGAGGLHGGGGGGGGYYGGGGGAGFLSFPFSEDETGGGGGSSFPADGVHEQGVHAGDGRVTIAYSVSPSLSTDASPDVDLGGDVSDTATLAGGDSPTGTITFELHGPSDADCSGAPVFTDTVAVSGNGEYASASFAPAEAGVYRWTASYSGDANNDPAVSPCNAPSESVIVSEPGAPAPLLGSLGPTSGHAGTVVTILGAGLTDASDVLFGGIEASFVVISDTQVKATVPAQPLGLARAARAPQGLAATVVPVVVVGPGGASNALSFTYLGLVISVPPPCDPLYRACAHGPTQAGTPPLAPPDGGDGGTAVGQARMPNLSATVTATWANGTIRVTVRVHISKPRLVNRWFLVRVRIPALDQTRLVRVSAHGKHVRTVHLGFTGPASTIDKRVVVRVDPTNRILETRRKDNTASARIR